MSDDHEFDLESARRASERGELAAWVREFLASPGSDNADLADDLDRRMQSWIGPVLLPFDQLHRLAGPPEEPTMDRMDDEDIEVAENMADSVEEGWEPPPFIVAYRNDQLVVEDGNHRIEGLRRAGETEGWSVVGFETPEQREAFAALELVEGAG